MIIVRATAYKNQDKKLVYKKKEDVQLDQNDTEKRQSLGKAARRL